MNNWQDKLEVKKGNIAEDIIMNKLMDSGFLVYKCQNNRSHEFDFVIKTKEKLSIIEVKCKELRLKYPDTGFPVSNWSTYLKQKNKLTILWVDCNKGEIYGNTIDELKKEKIIIHNGKKLKYPSIEKHDIIYFAYDQMKIYAKLTGEEISRIKKAIDDMITEI